MRIDCPGCGRGRRVFVERAVGLDRLCPACREIELLVAPDPDELEANVGPEGWPDGWRYADEEEPPRKWAARVWREWRPAERAEVAGALMSLREALAGAGEGESARHRRRAA